MTRRAFLVAALLLTAVGCKRGAPHEDPPPASVKILEDTIVVKAGAIGVNDPTHPRASYVLFDVENGSSEDRVVACEGTLEDAAGATLEPLRVKDLVVPAGTRRTFALVADAVHENAKQAHLTIRRAPIAAQPPVVTIQDVKVTHDDEQGTVAEFRAVNSAPQLAVTTVIASFHDDAGHILARPYSIIDVNPKDSRPFRLAGPKAATKVDVYVGDVVF